MCCFELLKMAISANTSAEYKPRKVQSMDLYFILFHCENVAWMSEYFLGENTETRGGALSNKQRMDVFLPHVGDPGFQTGVGEEMGIHQSTVLFRLPKMICKISLHFHAQLVHLTAHMCKFKPGLHGD